MIGLLTVALAQAAMSSPPHGPARVLTQAETNLMKNYVSKDMLDPDSARWKMPKVFLPVKGKMAGYYCGLVNAKNAYGAYTGYRKFSGLYEIKGGKIEPVLMTIESPTSHADQMIRSLGIDRCKSEGYELDEL
jgi:hypothetical protein